jgi:bifunctional non-homologous end joining protein LigD
VRGLLDGELVAFGSDGKPDFERVCECMLHRHSEIPLTFVAFDLLSLDGRELMHEPYRERRRILEGLGLEGPRWRVPEAFDDGPALWEAVWEHGLEGVVAKRLHERYLPGERAWVKVKNRAYWRYELEREGAIRSHQRRREPLLRG